MSRNRIRFFFGTVLAATLLLSAHSYTSAQQTRRTNPVRPRNQTPAARPTANRPAPGNAAAAKPSPRTTSQTAAGQKPQVMAVVNGETISRTDLAKECLKRYGEPVLESVVNKSLIFQECKRKGITVTAQDVEQEIAHMAERFNMSVGRWLELLQEERNVTAEQYRRDIIWPTVALKRLVASELTVSPEELANEFESEYGPKVQVRMIATNSQNDANAVLAKAKAGEDFGKLAKNHSVDANSAAARGLIPPIRKHMGDDAIEKVAFALQPGEVSQVIPFANQFLILKCERHLAASQISPEFKQDAENRLKEQILDRRLREASGQLALKLQNDAKITNVFNDPKLKERLPGVAAVINGEQVTLASLAEECLERHGDLVLDSEINYRLLRQALKRNGKTVEQPELVEEVDRAAEMYGYINNGKPDRDRWLKDVQEQEGMDVDTYVREAVWPTVALKKLVAEQVKVTEEDLQKGFEANFGPAVEVLAIVLSNQRRAQEVWEQARNNPTKEFFGELASLHSIEPVSRANMGEVPPIRKHGGQPLIETEAYRLTDKDPLSGIISVADRFIIMFYTGRTQPVVTEMDAEVRKELYRELQEKKLRVAMAEEFDRLKETAQIDNFLKHTTQSGVRQAAARPASTSPQLVRPASQRTRRTVK